MCLKFCMCLYVGKKFDNLYLYVLFGYYLYICVCCLFIVELFMVIMYEFNMCFYIYV